MNDIQNTGRASDLLGEMNIRDYLEIAHRRKWWIIFATLPIAITFGVLAALLPNMYRSSTVILVDPQKVPDSYVASTVSSGISDRLSTIQQEVTSPTRLAKLIDTLHLFPELRGKVDNSELVARMQKNMKLEVVDEGGRRTSAFKITYSSTNPLETAQVANQLAAMFIEENLKVREQQSIGTAEFLDSELQKTKQDLTAKEAELSEIKSKYIMDLPDSKQYHLEALTNLRTQLQALQERVSRAQQEKIYLQSLSSSNPPSVDVDDQSASASPAQVQITRLETRLGELRARYGPMHPDVKKVEAELAQLRQRAEKEGPIQPVKRAEAPKSDAAKITRNPVLQAQMQKLDDEIDTARKQEAPLQQQIEFHTSKLEKVPVFEQRIAELMRDYDTMRAHYTQLLDKKFSADMSSALESRQKGERFVILDPALIPQQPFGPNRPLVAFGGLLGGLILGIALAVIVELNDDSVRSDHEALKLIGKPILASIPEVVTGQQQRFGAVRVAAALLITVAGSAAFGVGASFVLRKFL